MHEKLRKKIMPSATGTAMHASANTIDIIQHAEVIATSESENSPLDNVVDGSTGPGSSQWVAGSTGPQSLIFKFDAPQNITGIIYEIEEQEIARTQEVCFEVSTDSGAHFREILRHEYNFSPNGSTFQREELKLDLPQITDLKMTIKPDKGNLNCLAKLNHIAFQM
ncbi:MAG: discoidin domain-containing protein [Gammaproteobacteria bacterium]|nr:discoidin domain-containing protein [Gammaproteobacteria bacterium]MBU1980099.1 discoidin domain-containing protein [Gammaproteobacteria bacterium]